MKTSEKEYKGYCYETNSLEILTPKGISVEILGGYPQFEMWILEIFTSSGQNITSRGAASRGDI